MDYDWSGTITPSKTGYHFDPTSLDVPAVSADVTGKDFTAVLNTYTVSGNAGVEGATINYGTGLTVISGTGGAYSFTVDYGWDGSVTPSLEGYTFAPAYRTYTDVTADQINQNFTPTLNTYTVSGNAGISGATITYTGNSITADSSGNYIFTVPHGWSGTITPSMVGYTFNPSSIDVPAVTANVTGQDFTATANDYTISGNVGIGEATINYTDGSTTADTSGDYSFGATYGWAGTITPSKTGYHFTPTSLDVPAVSANVTDQDFTAALNTYTVTVTMVGTGNVTVTSNPAGISCTSGICSANFTHGTPVTLTATPATSYFRLKNWSDDCTGNGTCSLTVTSAKTVNANIETSTFADVAFDYSETIGLVSYNFYPYIEALYDGGFTSGCSTSPLRYCPANNLTRAEAAVFMLRAVEGIGFSPTVPQNPHFTADDYTGAGSWAQAWVEAMYSEGLSAGCGVANSYCPWVELARDEASVFALRIQNGSGWLPPDDYEVKGTFADVDPSSWGAAWVEIAYAEGLLPACGYDDIEDKPMACPSGTVSRGLAAYMIVNAKDLPLPE